MSLERGDRQGRNEGRNEGKERERGRKEGKRKKEGKREKVKEGEGGKEEEREIKENTTLLCCKNGQLTYHICNLILLPSSSIVLILKSITGEERKEERDKD